MSFSVGSRCRSDARFWIACSISEFTYRTIGASSPAEVRFATIAGSGRSDSAMSPRSLSSRLQPVDDPAQLAAGHHHRPDGQPGGRADVVEGHHVAGVGDPDDDLGVGHRQPEHPVPQHQREWDLRDRGRVDRVADEVDAVDAERVRGRLGQLGLGDQPVVDQHVPEGPAGAVGLGQRAFDRDRVRPARLQGIEQRSEGLIHGSPTAVGAAVRPTGQRRSASAALRSAPGAAI